MKRVSLGAWLAACAGIAWCARYTGPMLNPFSLDGVLRDDWAQHCLGWLYFRNAGPSFPLGKLPNFLHPVGTTLGYMDAIPWVALVMRPFSALLPADFQYLGIWIVLCSGVMAFTAARLASAVTPHWEQQALVGAFTAMYPVLIPRIGHPALCAHVLIVAALGIGVGRNEDARAARRAVLRALGLVVLSAATHPYLSVMTLAILVGLPLRLRGHLGGLLSCSAVVGLPAAAGIVFAALGYLGGTAQDQVGGFGRYSANLNALFNSMGHSRLLPGLPHTYEQYEGYAYLGAGMLVASVVAVLLLVPRNTRQRIFSLPWHRTVWSAIAVIGCGLFAFASPIRWGERDVLTVPFYQYLGPVTDGFRSSGRFIWPLAYAIALGVTLSIVCALRPWRLATTATLLGLTALQAYDLRLDGALGRFAQPRTGQYAAAAWSEAEREFEHLVLYPTQVKNRCEPARQLPVHVVNELAYLAYRHNWTFNSGYAARYPAEQRRYCEDVNNEIAAGKLQPKTLYVVSHRDARRMKRSGAVCGDVDTLTVCALPTGGPFSNALAAPRP